MNTRRLTMLSELLDSPAVMQHALKDKTFDLNTWECGTSACAVGYAMNHPPFIAEGLTKREYSWAGTGPDDPARSEYFPACDGAEGLEAAQKFFGIQYETAEMLFFEEYYSPSKVTDPSIVAARIRELLLVGERELFDKYYRYADD